MSNQPSNIPERLLELLIRRSTEGISEAENEELLSAIEQSADRDSLLREIDRLDFTAAAIGLTGPEASSLSDSSQTDRDTMDSSSLEDMMPASLRDSILLDAGKFFADQSETTSGISSIDSAANNLSEMQSPELQPSVIRSSVGENRFKMREALGWLVAAAAVALLLTGYNPFAQAPDATIAVSTPDEKTTEIERPEQRLVATVMTPAEQYQAFLDSPPDDLVQMPWQPNDDANAAGEVVWSDKLQQGFMCFSRLDINDPTISQYQLWIFDTDVKQAYPVDGGVFDIDGSVSKAVVAIDARIPVKKAVQFAVTEEEPGGTVVSERKIIPVLATVTL